MMLITCRQCADSGSRAQCSHARPSLWLAVLGPNEDSTSVIGGFLSRCFCAAAYANETAPRCDTRPRGLC